MTGGCVRFLGLVYTSAVGDVVMENSVGWIGAVEEPGIKMKKSPLYMSLSDTSVSQWAISLS